MKVLLVNTSPHKNGCTFTALDEIAKTLNEEGIESEIYFVGADVIAPCRACAACREIGKCIINDKVNDFVEKAAGFDGFIIGSPVHYASASAIATTFLDRVFYSAFMSGRGDIFRHKPASAIVSARRAGTTATLDELCKYFSITEMPIISGRYWNMVHGRTPQDVMKDLEGLQNMRILARNMAWHLKCQEAGKKAGVPMPKQEEIVFTDFINN